MLSAALCGCDEPASAPEPNVNVEEESQELRDDIDEVRSEAKERVEKTSQELPDLSQDAGGAEQ